MKDNSDKKGYPASGISRRRFLSTTATLAGGLVICGRAALSAERRTHRALFQEAVEGGGVRCGLCPHACLIMEGRRGICGVRRNDGGTLSSLVYGYPSSIHIDPVEKKPFFHVLPGTSALSLSTAGCNMSCKFCQNWQISQSAPEDIRASYVDPSQISSKGLEYGAASIAYTYGEPVVFYEYMTDIAVEARKDGLLNLVVTNGYYSTEAIEALCRHVDAVKVDLKSFRDDYYRSVCGGSLAPVLGSLRSIAGSGIWLEIVYLMVPGLNDSAGEIDGMADWIAGELGPDVPIHLSRFFPQYKLADLPPTPISSLERARDSFLARGMRYVYIGNVPDHPAVNTACHYCGRTVIERFGYRIRRLDMDGDRCGHCGEKIPGLWERAL